MLDSFFASTGGSVTITEIMLCTGTALLFGMIIAAVHMYKNSYSKNFVLTLALLPVMVQSVIMVVNGNLGAGVAVAGAFSLVRFRSAPGNAREIVSIFFAMAVGLSAGMGYIIYAGFFTVAISAVILLYSVLNLGERSPSVKSLRIVIPEDLDYSSAFDDVFKSFASSASLERTRTTNLGSLYELQYTVSLKDRNKEKAMIDELRKRNGNLNITSSKIVPTKDEL